MPIKPMNLLCCAYHGTRRSNREDAYKIKEPDEPAAPVPTVNIELPKVKFSWDNRPAVDLDQLTVKQIEKDVRCKRFDGEPAIIENCIESCVFILGHTTAVNVDDCRDCLFILGPCAGSVFVRDCDNCTVISVCQQFRMRDCHRSKLALHCKSEPIIEQCTDIMLHHLSLYYSRISMDIKSAGLDLHRNLATSVHDFTPNRSQSNYKISINNLVLTNEEERAIRSNDIFVDMRSSAFPPPAGIDYPISAVHSCSMDEPAWSDFAQAVSSHSVPNFGNHQIKINEDDIKGLRLSATDGDTLRVLILEKRALPDILDLLDTTEDVEVAEDQKSLDIFNFVRDKI